MPRPSRVHRFKDNGSNCWASIVLSSGEPCWISVSPGSVVVKRSRFGLFGSLIYRETDGRRNAAIAAALSRAVPNSLLPHGFSTAALSSFTNAALYCSNSSELSHLLDKAAAEGEQQHDMNTE